VLPDVEAEHGLLAFHDRGVLVGGALDREFRAGVDDPCPSAAEPADARLRKLLFEGIEAAERVVDGGRDRAGRRAAGIRRSGLAAG
jgi:hypothetical protein